MVAAGDAMWRAINVKLNERAVTLRKGLPVRALGPGRHRIWGWHVTIRVWDTNTLLFQAEPAVREVLPPSWFREVVLSRRERGVLYRDERPVAFLRPGVHRYRTVDPSVRLDVLSVDEPVPELTDELLAILPKSELAIGYVGQHERGLKYVQGKFAELLAPGRYAFWSHPEAKVGVHSVDVRMTQTTLAPQELMTRDKVTLRLTISVEYAVIDPARAAHGVADVSQSIYLIVQLAARDYVASSTLDQLLESRDAMARFLTEDAAPKMAGFGVQLERVGVKDVVLPGEMKSLLNRVIEAEKEAAANVILRREETAATRSLANTAKVMAENPVLLRLKELETLKEIAERIDEVRVIVGADGISTLLPAGLLVK